MAKDNFTVPRGFICDVCRARLDLTTRITIELVPPTEEQKKWHGESAVQSVDTSNTVSQLIDPSRWGAWGGAQREPDKIAASHGWTCYVGTRSQRHYCPACSEKPKSSTMKRYW